MQKEIKDSHYNVSADEVARNHQALLEAIKNPEFDTLIRNFEFHMSDTKSKILRTDMLPSSLDKLSLKA